MRPETGSAKVGDELAFLAGYGRGVWVIYRVDKITPSGRINCGPYTLNPNFTVRGHDHGTPCEAHIVTEDIREKIARNQLLRKFQAMKFDTFSTDKLTRAMEVFSE